VVDMPLGEENDDSETSGKENDDIEALTAEIEDLRSRVDGISRNLGWLIVFVVLLFMTSLTINYGQYSFLTAVFWLIVLVTVLAYCRSIERHGL